MAKLILSMDGLVLKEIPLAKERTTIGRKPHNDIQIDNLAVSGEHAVIVTILNDSFLEDLGSTNGTVVNGNPIKKHFLQNNDVIELGKYKLKFVGEASGAAAGGDKADFEKTMVLRPASARAEPAARRCDRPRARSARPRCRRRASRGGRNRRMPPRRSRRRPSAAAAAPGRPAARRDPASLGRERRQGARAHQAAHHARQARRAGRGSHAPAAGLLHHPRRGRGAPQRERPADRRRRPTRSRITTSSSSPASRWNSSSRLEALRQHLARIAMGLAIVLFFLVDAAQKYPTADGRLPFLAQLDNILYDTRLNLAMPRGVDPSVVILDIDEKSLGEVGRWPWSRRPHGRADRRSCSTATASRCSPSTSSGPSATRARASTRSTRWRRRT